MNYRMLFFAGSILLAVVALSVAYGLEQYWVGTMTAMGIGGLGYYGWYRSKKTLSNWSTDLFLAGMVLLVTIGALLELKTYLLFAALAGTLGAWDLIRFQRRVGQSPISEDIRQVEKRHLTLLGFTLLAGGILAGVMVTVRMQISFGLTLVFGIILIITMGQVFRLLRN